MRIGKIIHSISALLLLAISICLIYKFPELWDNNVTRFATVGFFLTFYGVLFGILEVMRARSATELVSAETSRVLQQVENLTGMKLLGECQAAIEIAVKVLDGREPVPLSMITAISRIYSQNFHRELMDANSTQRRNSAMLESYAIASGRKVVGADAAKLRGALIAMTNEIAIETARKSKIGVPHDPKAA
jgi:hypothetical protein